MIGRSLDDIEGSFEVASVIEDLAKISSLTKALATAVAKGVYSGGQGHSELKDYINSAFFEGLDDAFAECEKVGFLTHDQQAMVSYINTEVFPVDEPGAMFFIEDDKITEFDSLWQAKKYPEALKTLAKGLQIESLKDLKAFFDD